MSTYISLAQAKAQLSIDDSLTVHDAAVEDLIGGAIDWAENYTNRSLGELIEINSPRDSVAVPLADPDTNDPSYPGVGWLWNRSTYSWVDSSGWASADYQAYYAQNVVTVDHSTPLRRDVKQALLLWIQAMFDRNIADMDKLITAAERILWPYRRAFGV